MATKPSAAVQFTTDSLIFAIIVAIVLAIIFATLVANAAYFGQISRDGGSTRVSASSAQWLVLLNGIMAFFAGAAFLYSIVNLLVGSSALNAAKRAAYAKTTGAINYVPGVGTVTSFTPGSNIYTSSAGQQFILTPSGQFQPITGTTIVGSGSTIRVPPAVIRPAAVIQPPVTVTAPAPVAAVLGTSDISLSSLTL